ncbi:Aminotransferase class V domain [Dillenia turbinata]|uniref:Aminotransferase class V domain n=1 Tax=Dillenia turbinata TaxID=194707 RepID=A0AAN8V2W6_9MAGN
MASKLLLRKLHQNASNLRRLSTTTAAAAVPTYDAGEEISMKGVKISGRPLYLDMQATLLSILGFLTRCFPITSPASETLTLALTSTAGNLISPSKKLANKSLISLTLLPKRSSSLQTEHKCVLDSCRHLQQEGFDVTYLPVESDGLVNLDKLRDAIRADTGLVSVMAVNNEIGALGKVPIDVENMNVSLMRGALGVGTVPTPLVVGFGAACELAAKEMEYDEKRIRGLQERLLNGIRAKLDGVVVNGSVEKRYPGNLNLSFAYVEGESLLMGLKEVAVSSGSACTSASLEPSYVLRALGVDEDMAHTRLGLGLEGSLLRRKLIGQLNLLSVRWRN